MEDKEEDKHSERIGLRGEFRITNRDKNGKVVSKRIIKNLILNAGKLIVAKLINDVDTPAHFNYLQIGTGTTAAVAADMALESFFAEDTATLTYESNYKAKFAKTFGAGVFPAGASIAEYGVANNDIASSPDLLCRAVDDPDVVVAGGSLEVEYIVAVD